MKNKKCYYEEQLEIVRNKLNMVLPVPYYETDHLTADEKAEIKDLITRIHMLKTLIKDTPYAPLTSDDFYENLFKED